ncbi:hypothetical protein JRO89_XS02G0156700 [Xanthoceras sorbifolium]|uniref:Pre-mRNA-splicing factor SLU7 n=1 Tax=Xanthoceras sorbifolium TaxID=99658 RepID=A0ABQ8IGF8_9ROSI|nr:hypothetical protein JRO89_XS02G0156700 [Xanthoceras sorbifolium]
MVEGVDYVTQMRRVRGERGHLDQLGDDSGLPELPHQRRFRLDSQQLNLRIREETAKYLLNLDVNSAYYDPITRYIREDPLPDAGSNEKFYGASASGQNFVKS